MAICCTLGMTYAAELPDAPEPQAILQRIRSKVADHLSSLPNYTCHEVINRLHQPLNSGIGAHDRVELEIAFIGKQELFARPGESSFSKQSITDLVTSGTIGSGVFGSYLDSIFVEGDASFHFIGLGKKHGHNTYQYHFEVPMEKSHFLVKHNSAEGIVAYQGSFWVDAETLDLVQLELSANDIPSRVGVRFVKEKVQYSTIRIRDSDFLLPTRSELRASDTSGNLSMNELRLERCQEFTGESTVTFGKPLDSHSADRESQDR